MKHIGFIFLPLIFVLFILNAEASAQSTYLNLYSQPGDDFGGRPNPNGKAFNYVESDGTWQLFCSDADHDGHADKITMRFFPTNDRSVAYWLITVGTGRTGSNLAPGYYDMAGEFGSPSFYVTRGFACSRSLANFTILESKIDESNPVFPRVISFAVRFTFLCDGIGPAGLTGIFSYNSTAPEIYIGPLILAESPYLPDLPVNVPYSRRLGMLGGVPPYTFQLINSLLPPGMSLNSEGLLEGTPTIVGDYWLDVFVKDVVYFPESNTHRSSFRVFFKVVEPPPPSPLGIATTTVANASKGQSYNFQLAAEGGRSPFDWTLAAGKLPEGLSITSDGIISGIAKTDGVFNFTVQVSDSFAQQARQDFSLKVVEPPSITKVKYKAKKGKLDISGEEFHQTAKLFIDGSEVIPKSQDATSLSVKKLFLTSGAHTIKVLNPDGGNATTALQVK
ncbi:MAG TPA: Ig domain-containing protein [Blastocatellia bacterium]|nr:Ig domain-containing protein [Blastocatellia bacterium]